jgi:hypothetical protein
MELKINGKIKVIGEKQTWDSGFTKVEFVITTAEQYPQDIKFEIVKDKADSFLQYNKVGDDVDVKFNVRGNEYNSKYYVNLQAWSVFKASAAEQPTTTAPPVVAQAEEDDLPF